MEIKDIKAQLTIGQVLDHYGIKVNKNRHCLCPFHEDKNPSMQVYPETNTVHCFSGNCEHTGKAIDVIDFILYQEGCTKHEAIVKAKQLIGGIEQIKQSAPGGKKEPLDQVFARLQQGLSRSEKAIAYLESRNLLESAKEIGYNSGPNYSRMSQCLVFPLRSQSGEIVSFYGRHINKPNHYYLPNRQGLYPGWPDQQTRTLILTESVIDAATVKQFTTYDVLALYGTNGLTPEHTAAMSQLNQLQEIIFFLDGDKAGRYATDKYAKQLHELLPGLRISGVDVPEGEDPNSLVCSHEANVLAHLIENREIRFEPINQRPAAKDQGSKNQPPVSQEPKIQGSATNNLKSSINGSLDTTNSEYLTYRKEPLLISVLGGIGLHPIDKLRVTLKIERPTSRSPLHQLRHSLDLYHDDQVEKLIRKAAERLELGTREMQLAIAALIQALEDYRQTLLEKKKPKKPATRIIPPERTKTAIKLMQRKGYLEKELPELLAQTGVVGEAINSLILWVTYASRKQKDPLHVICLGASGTGKTYLQERITDLVPEEDKVSGTAISENALYYAQDLNLKNKLFIIEDLDGASNILYALRELQTKKTISKMVTQKDSKGNMKTEIVTVHGPICLTATTTKERLYEDNANRCLLIYLDGSKAQQEAIMDDQRRRSAGKIDLKARAETRELLQDMQALYEPITVRNPYAEQLRIPETVFKPLRTNSHYLAFIEGITFCCQWQKQKHTDPNTGEQFINTEIADIALANRLLKEVLLSKSDELTKACRSFFELLKRWLAQEQKSSFYSREIRQAYRMSPATVKRHISDLVRYGYLAIAGGSKAKGFEYELSNQGEYEQLQDRVNNALEVALEQIRDENQPSATV